MVVIDLGDDGRSDLLVYGEGVLESTHEILPSANDGLESLIREPDGTWRHAQSFRRLSSAYDTDAIGCADIDGDGRKDIVAAWVDYTQDYGHRLGVDLLLQDAAGDLHRNASAHLDSVDYLVSLDAIAAEPGSPGRALVTSVVDAHDDVYLAGTVLEWSAQEGWKRLWGPEPDSLLTIEREEGSTAVLPGEPDPLLLGTSRRILEPNRAGRAIPILDDGWGPATNFALPSGCSFFRLDAPTGGEVWGWCPSRDDTLYQMVRIPGTNTVTAKAIPIEGLPVRANVDMRDALATAEGERYFLARSVYSGAVLIQVSDGSARVISSWNGPWNGGPNRLLVAPAGRIEVLWGSSSACRIVQPRTILPPAPAVYMPISECAAKADFDQDGLLDLVLRASINGVSGMSLVLGMDHAPWFRDGGPVLSTADLPGALRQSLPCDLDGDGHPDLVHLIEGDSTFTLMGQIWDGWRFRHVPEDDGRFVANAAIMTAGDLDGDGCDEVLLRMRPTDYGATQAWIRKWTHAGTALPPVMITNPDIADDDLLTPDIDGDGVAELFAGESRRVHLWRVNVDTGTASSLGAWMNSPGLYSANIVDLDSNGTDDIFCLGSNDAWIWSLDNAAPVSFRRTQIPFLPYLDYTTSDIDLDADGRRELLFMDSSGFVEVISNPLEDPTRSVWAVPDSLAAAEMVYPDPIVWSDVDRDGDPDLVLLCADGIRVQRNPVLQRATSRSEATMLRLTGRNPSSDEIRLAICAHDRGPIQIGLFDVSGRRVAHEELRPTIDGWIETTIRPRVGRAALPSGVYFLRVEGSGRVETRRVVLGF